MFITFDPCFFCVVMEATTPFHAQYAVDIADILDHSVNFVHLALGALVVHSMEFIILSFVLVSQQFYLQRAVPDAGK